ncbi:hypothetical protein TorRG33x02_114020 [Trema orientale]|uniref:Uncharacterized protein n=1 Tax=Trema orientale TaxID=63057 RepID=A0A2P5F4V2_TREOI|nr:hypothetical protein TorRG33x02_114020 [Trema orientale]
MKVTCVIFFHNNINNASLLSHNIVSVIQYSSWHHQNPKHVPSTNGRYHRVVVWAVGSTSLILYREEYA